MKEYVIAELLYDYKKKPTHKQTNQNQPNQILFKRGKTLL